MSRPGAWATVWHNFKKYLRKDWSKKTYVAEDSAGRRYYEISNTRQNVTRGFDPPPNAPPSQPSVEWQSWLKGTRRFPPSDEEIALNRTRQQAQLVQNTSTEQRAPHVATTGSNYPRDKPQQFPQHDDLESAPGAKKSDQ
ncbi:NADH:ubiquinone oxidoreductase domain containing protein [Trichostrongylus colubriformis]|uniref:NADH:ubiquinone oxidoreductase domain containing protein n=1 Tax=Trichostrongylus colubriformis TaxID=6319 RepID=A0AAN8IRR6_TRICO